MDPSLERRRAELEQQRSDLVAAIEATREARRLTFADDEHDPDGSTASLDQARDRALLDRVERSLAALAAAAERRAAGEYGRCTRCGTMIPAERLEARPEADRCVDCAASRGGAQRSRTNQADTGVSSRRGAKR